MCDADENLLYYKNGYTVINKNQKTLINGDNINPGKLHHDWCLNEGYFVLLQSIINIPFSNETSKIGIFHVSALNIKGVTNVRRVPCYYSEIDITKENGR